MYISKFKSLLVTLLCLLISLAGEAQNYVTPSLANDEEVCIFLSSPDNNAKYTFYGIGGDYKNGTESPGDAFVLQGQQFDGSYLYKWERPSTATGVPQTMTIFKNGSADANIIYDQKAFVNHGLFKELTVSQTNDVVSYTETISQDKEVELKDGTKITLTGGSDHDFYFESPKDLTFNLWMYYKNYGPTNSDYDEFTNLGKWPGDPLTKLGQLKNGNYIYKGVQAKNTDITPTSLIINYNNGSNQFPELVYTPHAYYTNTVTATTATVVSQYGRAYPNYTPSTTNIDPLATLNSQDEISVFLESPEENATYYAWPWSDEHNDGNWFSLNAGWPGSTFTKVGQLSNKNYLYKWTQDSHIIDRPTNLIISKNDAETRLFDGGFSNHGYYVESTQDDKTVATYTETVTKLVNGAYTTSRTTYGKRVIYEMNVGSFTPDGTFSSAQKQLSNLKNLGIDVVWLMPIYSRGNISNSPYAVKDFKGINASYGKLSDLKSFVTTAHQLGMDVWLDFVPNHTATDNAWVTSHPEYYTKVNDKMVHPASDGKYYTDDQTAPDGVTVYTDVYQLDYTTEVDADKNDAHNPAGRAIEDALKYWLNETDIDGFRFDYVSTPSIPNAFWSSTLSDLRAIKPSLQFLAEADFTRNKNVSASNFHYDYAWTLNDNLREFGQSTTTYEDTGGKDLAHITSSFLQSISNVYTDPMIYLTNHDKNWNETKKTLKVIWGDNRYAMTVLEFALPGMPLIYNGQEQNGDVAIDYFKDEKIQWASTSDPVMMGLIQELAYMKHTCNALNDGGNASQRGETHVLNTYNHNVLAIERIKGTEHFIAVLNLAGTDQNSNILGATRGRWRRVLLGDNSKMDNEILDVDITDNWRLEGIPAHGYEIFTYKGESNGYAAGMYLVTDDSWDNPTKHQMIATGSDASYQYYQYEIKGSDFDAMNTPAGGTAPIETTDPLYFKMQEYYDFLNMGTICKTDQMFSAKSIDNAQFKEGGAKQFDAVKGDGNAPSFSIVRSTDDVDKFIITFARSIADPNSGYVKLEVVKNGDIQTGFYLLTPVNINSQNAGERHQWRFNYKDEDPDAVSDKYITDLNEDKRNLSSYVIDASQFDTYIPTERRAGNTIQFKIRQYAIPDGKTTPEDNSGYVSPIKDDKDNDNSTFDASKGDKVYSDAHWDALADNDAYFKILYRPDVARYIIQLWQTGSGNDGKTRVRVYYVRKYNYAGSTIENVSASNEDVYLYNVDAQKFLYVGNKWGTMASLLYDDLGTRLNISDGVTGENSNYKLIRTRFEGAGIVPDGYMLGIDDFGYNANADDPFNRLDSANIYCDRNNGNRWIFEKADTIDYANTYTLKLFNTKDNRFHYMIADHSDTDKAKNTQVKYIAVDNKRYTAADLTKNGAVQDKAESRNGYIAIVGTNGTRKGTIKFDYNAAFAGTYDISINYITGKERKLNINISSPDGSSTDYEQTSGNTGSWDNANRFETMHYAVKMQKGVNNITFGDQDEPAPNITEISITLSHPSDLKYGRWQLVTYKDLVAKLKNENAELYGGTTADATFLLTDQGFTRNVPVTWSTDNGQTILDGSNTTSNVVLTKNTIGANPNSGMYWNGHITGKGCVYQDISVPMYGIYQFDAYGYYKGSPTQMYYQYATEIDANGNVTKWSAMQDNTPLKDDAPEYKGVDTDVATGTLFYDESVLDHDPAHRITQFIYMPQKAEGAAVDKDGNYRLRIGFYKTADATGDYTAVDDVHLHYNGKSPFILDDSWSEETKNTKLTSDVRENVPVYIKREFWADQWNALVLPVSVSTAQLRQIFGDGVQVASPYGLDDNDPYLIRFTPIDLSSGSIAIEAGRFYIVKPDKLVGTSQVMTITKKSENSYTPSSETVTNADGDNVQFYNLGSHDLKGMLTTVADLNVNTVGFHAGSDKHPEHNTIHFVGSFCKTKAPAKSYVIASDGNMYHLATEHDLGGFRFYIADDDNTKTASKAFTFGSLSDDLDAVLSSFGNNKGEATGIQNIYVIHDPDGSLGNGNVYDLSGKRVAVNGKIDKLPSGVYIVNGKKYIKK